MKFFLRAQKAGFTIPDFSQNKNYFPETQCKILDGKLLSAHFVQEAQKLGAGRKTPCLAVILVGDNPASQVYVKNKIKIFKDSGFESQSYFMTGAEITEKNIIMRIEQLNADKNVDGILVQLPLPKGLNTEKILNHIHPKKDVDGFLPFNIGSLATGAFQSPIACTPLGVMVMLQAYGIPLTGKKAVVVGRSNIVGKPMALLLLSSDATVTIAHSKTKNVSEVCRQADILVAAAGSREIIQSEYVKPGAVVIDVGMHKNPDGKLCGDVHAAVKKSVAALSPVPGGVGPMTIAMLMLNTALTAWGE